MSPTVPSAPRRSRRLKGLDYSLPGAYFVTVCVQGRRLLFGEVRGGVMRPNDAGRMVSRWWSELRSKFPSVQPDEHVVMPNHLHGIIILLPAEAGGRPPSPSLPGIVRWLKTMTTNDYVAGVRASGWSAFDARLWQRDYHDHVLREGEDLNTFRRYIRENPARWEADEENPVPFGLPQRWGGPLQARHLSRVEEGPHIGGPLQKKKPRP